MPKTLYTEVQVPEIVREAMAVAREVGFPRMPDGCPPAEYQGPPTACISEVGRLLRTLAATVAGRPGGLIGEQGTGSGVGTAWLVSGMGSESRLVSAELDPVYAAAAARLFARFPNVEIRAGDWHEVLHGEGPFDLLFMDAIPGSGDLDPERWDRVTELVKVGGLIVMDDLTPVDLWPAEWDSFVDPKREFALANPRVAGTELRIAPSMSVLIAARLR